MKLHERLGLRSTIWSQADKIEGVEIAKNVNPKADEYDRAWKKFNLPACRHFLSLAHYYSDEHGLVKEHADQCIPELEEFFFGDWRNTFQTPVRLLRFFGRWARGIEYHGIHHQRLLCPKAP